MHRSKRQLVELMLILLCSSAFSIGIRVHNTKDREGGSSSAPATKKGQGAHFPPEKSPDEVRPQTLPVRDELKTLQNDVLLHFPLEKSPDEVRPQTLPLRDELKTLQNDVLLYKTHVKLYKKHVKLYEKHGKKDAFALFARDSSPPSKFEKGWITVDLARFKKALLELGSDAGEGLNAGELEALREHIVRDSDGAITRHEFRMFTWATEKGAQGTNGSALGRKPLTLPLRDEVHPQIPQILFATQPKVRLALKTLHNDMLLYETHVVLYVKRVLLYGEKHAFALFAWHGSGTVDLAKFKEALKELGSDAGDFLNDRQLEALRRHIVRDSDGAIARRMRISARNRS